MHSKFSVTPTQKWPYSHSTLPCGDFCRFGVSVRSQVEHKHRFKLVCQSLGDRWKLSEIDTAAVQEQLSSWLFKTRVFLNEVASPLVKTGGGRSPDPGDPIDDEDVEDMFMGEQTIQSRTPNGYLSVASIASIEQFSRMNGMTGQQMQQIFKALVTESMHGDARNLVEYCCFRFLSRDNSEVHPCLKELAFQRLIFVTMLAWQSPYEEENDSYYEPLKRISFKTKLVYEEAFVRIAPAVSGLADRVTAHNLFKALAGDEGGVSFKTWSTYISEVLKVHEDRKVNQAQEFSHLSGENLLCIAPSRKRPVLKWTNNMAWPGKLTLTDKALYFEAIGLKEKKEVRRLDLTGRASRVEKVKVGPLGSGLFDSAVSVTSSDKSETWVLEFVDLAGEMRRDVWFAFISEVIALYKFMREYGPERSDPSVEYVYGASKGNERAITSAVNSITRLQALQFMRKLLDDPAKLVQFSYLQNAPYGDIVCQTLALNYWGGQLVTKYSDSGTRAMQKVKPYGISTDSSLHVVDLDGSVFLRKWMRSPSWATSASLAFWKSSLPVRKGVLLSKNLVVSDQTLVERAARICKQKYQVVEKTQATIDAAMIKGIPSNIDLFKELMLPLSIIAQNFEKLRHWEDPPLTVTFLVLAYTLIFRNMLSYIFPATLMAMGASMLLLKGLREQGRLGRSFGKVTIRDQPPSNTIQQILAVKQAMLDVESFLQKINVALLKVRNILVSGQPQVTTEVAVVLLSAATALLLIPFKYILSFVLFDLFTRELEFRRAMVKRFMALLKERWDTVPAAPVVVLPHDNEQAKSPPTQKKELKDKSKPETSPGSNLNNIHKN
uniref:Uncharacterized protein n=2 Tax=Kalanchoe fedtschenkoi TaxID=63787 RepID=A0A7N0RFT4_KALFE